MNKLRRRALIGGALLSGAAYINHRGLRYPRMGFSPPPLDSKRSSEHVDIQTKDCIFLDDLNENASDQEALALRSCSPNATLYIKAHQTGVTLRVNNVSPQAKLRVDGINPNAISEQTLGINRLLTILRAPGRPFSLSWQPYNVDTCNYAVIGDTGGGHELDWCLQRAAQLGAEFLLHLGDLNYSKGEYQRAIAALHNAPLPVYVSIGNHDFNDSGLVYDHFLRNIGPLNSSFSRAGSRIVSIDTAASFLPVYSGNRARLISSLKDDSTLFDDTAFFSHKPFYDVRDREKQHNMSGVGELSWVYGAMQALKADTFVCGHVHRSSVDNHKTITQITAGEGLGFEDLRYQKHSAKILLASTSAGSKTRFTWEDLAMPWSFHTSPTHVDKMKKQNLQAQLEWYRKLLS